MKLEYKIRISRVYNDEETEINTITVTAAQSHFSIPSFNIALREILLSDIARLIADLKKKFEANRRVEEI